MLYVNSMPEKKRYALAALGAMDNQGTSPKQVALKMVDLGFKTDKTSWMASMGKTLHDMGESVGRGNGRTVAQYGDDPTQRWQNQPILVWYDYDRQTTQGWSPFFLSAHGERWFAKYGAGYLGQATVDTEPIECPECGGLVLNVDNHAAWHRKVADLIEAMVATTLEKERASKGA